MHTLRNAALALFRPAKGVDGAAASLKWLWIPILVLLLASIAAKTAIMTPLSMKQAEKAAQEQMQEAVDRGEIKEADVPEDVVGQTGSIVSTAAMVFAVLGAAGSVLYVTLFFFVAAKTWANPVAFSTMLSVAALSFVPRALGNLVQAAYMQATGVLLAHPGLGALVAPSDPLKPPTGVAYALLSQIDVWVIWGLAILFGALLSQTVGINRKRAITAMVSFIAITGLLRAVPTLVTGAFLGAMG